MSQDQDYMSIALDLARLAEGRTSPNPLVGCLIVKEGRIVATGFHKKAGLPHAEVEALRRCSGQATKGATLYVNLEPCCPPKRGRTPPCTDAIIQSGIRRVVVGIKDPDPQVSGKGIRVLREAGIKVTVGLLEKECRKLNQAYLIHRTQHRPLVILKMATTLEGMVGWRGRGEINGSLQVTGRKAQWLAHTYRDQVDAILVGIGTVLADNPRLTTRLPDRIGHDPLKIVLDTNLRIPISSKLIQRSPTKTLIVTGVRGRWQKISALQSRGVEVIPCPTNRMGQIDLHALLKILADRGILTLLVEGGPTVWTGFLEKGFGDQFLHFIGTRPRHRISRRQALFAPLCLLAERIDDFESRQVGPDLLISGNLSTPESGV